MRQPPSTLPCSACPPAHTIPQSFPNQWRELPPDLLRRCFAAAFAPPDQPAPLLEHGRQWFALRLTCKAWAAALESAPVQVRWWVHALVGG